MRHRAASCEKVRHRSAVNQEVRNVPLYRVTPAGAAPCIRQAPSITGATARGNREFPGGLQSVEVLTVPELAQMAADGLPLPVAARATVVAYRVGRARQAMKLEQRAAELEERHAERNAAREAEREAKRAQMLAEREARARQRAKVKAAATRAATRAAKTRDQQAAVEEAVEAVPLTEPLAALPDLEDDGSVASATLAPWDVDSSVEGEEDFDCAPWD